MLLPFRGSIKHLDAAHFIACCTNRLRNFSSICLARIESYHNIFRARTDINTAHPIQVRKDTPYPLARGASGHTGGNGHNRRFFPSRPCHGGEHGNEQQCGHKVNNCRASLVHKIFLLPQMNFQKADIKDNLASKPVPVQRKDLFLSLSGRASSGKAPRRQIKALGMTSPQPPRTFLFSRIFFSISDGSPK